MAPHICEEIWEIAFDGNSELATGQWPEADASFIVDDIIVLPIQVNGKMRGNIEVPTDIGENELKEKILEM